MRTSRLFFDLFRKAYSSIASNATAEQLRFRRDTVALLQKWDTPFTTNSLTDIIASFVRKGDLSIALPLYTLAIQRKTFDESTKLGNYILVELLQQSLIESVEFTNLLYSNQRLPADYILETLYDRIFSEADHELLERLRASWTIHRIEQAIIQVYLRSGDISGVVNLLCLAEKQSFVLSQTIWQEIMEVIIQPFSNEQQNLTRNVLQASDRRFDKLEQFLDLLKKNNVKLTTRAVNALQQIMSTTIAPPNFLDYLQNYSQ